MDFDALIDGIVVWSAGAPHKIASHRWWETYLSMIDRFKYSLVCYRDGGEVLIPATSWRSIMGSEWPGVGADATESEHSFNWLAPVYVDARRDAASSISVMIDPSRIEFLELLFRLMDEVGLTLGESGRYSLAVTREEYSKLVPQAVTTELGVPQVVHSADELRHWLSDRCPSK